MNRVLNLVCFFLFFLLVKTHGQCPTLNLSSTTGSTCGITAITISGNTFGGSANKVTITENGAGTVSPTSSTASPFSFAYTPRSSDIGKKITITISTNDPKGSCNAAKSTYTLTVSEVPQAPVAGTITRPTCAVLTGSVILTGLPSTETWTLTRLPGNVKTTGTGASFTIDNLTTGTYTFTVTNSEGCTSPSSQNVVIPSQPDPPEAPAQTTDCTPGDGGAVVKVTSPVGSGLTYSIDGGTFQSSTSFSNITDGNHVISVRNSAGCTTTGNSFQVACGCIPPPAPEIGTITQPGSGITTGSVVLSGLPATGAWTLKRLPDNFTVQGTGTTLIISGLLPGTYNFTVTNSNQCSSGLSAAVLIETTSEKPVVVINFPPPVCFPATVDLTDPKITAGSTPNLIYTYWTDASGTIPYSTPKASTSGTWYIKGTSSSTGTFAIEPVMVTIFHIPLANAGADQSLTGQTSTQLDAGLINSYETGLWSVISGRGDFFDPSYPKTSVSGLSEDKNIFIWKVTNGVCAASIDTVVITLHGQLIPTLITPNMDGKNDYLVVKGLDVADKIELIVFDRRGVQVYKNENYDNRWNGIDMNGNPLASDTYFYILRTNKNIELSGYVLIRK